MYKVLAIGTRENYELDTLTHYHEHWEFVYYTAGYGTFRNGNVEKDFLPHLCVAHPPHSPHSEYVNGYFSNIYVQADMGDALPHELFYYDDQNMHEIEMIFTQLQYHFTRKRENWKEILDALLALLAQLLISKPPSYTFSECVDAALTMIIHGVYDSSFQIASIYENIPLSKPYFTTLFRQSTGMTPLQYLTEKRMENAKKLLLQKEELRLSIGEIADMCGYNDIYYFSRIFKKHTGLSPTQWSKQNE